MERREKGRENNKDELFRIRIVTLRLASAITDNKKLYTTTLFKLNYFSFLKWGNDCQKEYFTGIHRHFNKITWLTTIKRIVFFFNFRRRAHSNPDSPIDNDASETINHVPSQNSQAGYLPTRYEFYILIIKKQTKKKTFNSN